MARLFYMSKATIRELTAAHSMGRLRRGATAGYFDTIAVHSVAFCAFSRPSTPKNVPGAGTKLVTRKKACS